MTESSNITEDHIDLLHTIEKDSNASQRQIASKTGLSIGKVNYILKSLVDIGFIKIENFNNSSKKINYLYVLTPKGIKEKYVEFNNLVRPDGINLDYEIDPRWARDKLKDVVIQGGLDPKILLMSDDKMLEGATKYINTFKDKPYVFNLGHGLLPETDPDKVEKLIKFYREF